MTNYAIYQPKGKAQEYAQWACNLYIGCSCGCSYCFNKHGRFAKVMGGNVPTLKKCFRDEDHALEVFEKELKVNLPELQKHGLFFSFSTDPCLSETWPLTCRAINMCRRYDVPFKILTKRTDWLIDEFIHELKTNGTIWNREPKQHLWAFGFTLTGHDSLEPGASTNAERIEAMKKLHNAGFKTFASIEPIIDFESSLKMIKAVASHCDLIGIGLLSNGKYDKKDVLPFVERVYNCVFKNKTKVYFKKSLRAYCKHYTLMAPQIYEQYLVDADYNIFKN